VARLAFCVVLVARVAAAQPVGDPDTEAARRHFFAGSKLYNEGRYEEAIAEFETAWRIKPLPALDFNIGRCHDRLEHWREALDAYQHYIDAAPTAPDAAEVRERITVLTARVNTPPAPPEAAPAPVVVAPPQPERAAMAPLRKAAIAVAVLTLSTGVAGAALLGNVSAGFSSLQSQCRVRQCTDTDVAGLRGQANAGYALLAIAGAAAIVDIALWVADARSRSHQAWWRAPGAMMVHF
jgi:tetratricopeptide (TPR) repeat protein